MISSQPAIPLLVHEDCMEGVHLDLAKQQASLSKISSNTESAKDTLSIIDGTLSGVVNSVGQIEMNTSQLERIALSTENIESNTSSIKTSSSNTATATSSLYSSVGTTADASTSNTVIGLLKSIANKL